jgi:membrane-bound serine protease (ClpP class)
LSAPIRGAAPDVKIGYLAPTVTGGSGDAVGERFPDAPAELVDGRVVVKEPIPGVVDVVSPSIGQFLVGLDGTEVEIGGEAVILATARTDIDGGIEVVKPLGRVVFDEPGLVTRTLRVTIRPEAAFLFLVLGISMITFEFYAAGPGVAAAVGALSLFLAAYGLAVLPTNWWAVAAVLVGLLLYVVDFQRNALGLAGLAGTGLLVFGGLALVDGGRQMPIVWWPIVLTVAAVGLFYGFALTTVARSRFSTATIGREHLIGAAGTAVSDLGPEGIVDVGGARWRAVARRAAGIRSGDPVEVVGVDGVILDVEPTRRGEA